MDNRSEKPRDSRTPPKDKKVEPKRNPEAMLMKSAPPKPNRPYTDESEPGRPKPLDSGSAPVRSKPSVKPKVNNAMMVQQKSENRMIQKKPMPPQNEVSIVIIYSDNCDIHFVVAIFYLTSKLQTFCPFAGKL